METIIVIVLIVFLVIYAIEHFPSGEGRKASDFMKSLLIFIVIVALILWLLGFVGPFHIIRG